MATIAAALGQQPLMTDEFLQSASTKGTPLYGPVEIVRKGKEGRLPDGQHFVDKDGHRRTDIRTRWYLPTEGHTYRSYALYSEEIQCDLPLDASVVAQAAPYPAGATPVFFGHYWLSAERPGILAENVACLDFSVAEYGFLCAYRWQGEEKLTNDNFAWVGAGRA